MVGQKSGGSRSPLLQICLSSTVLLLFAACEEDVGPQPLEMIPTDVGAAWSPDGSMLAVDYRPGDASDAADGVYTIDLATGDRQLVAPFFGGPNWSPDGSKLAFSSGGTIGIVELGSMATMNLDLEGLSFDPSWSPDGSTIAFVSNLGISNPPVVYLMNSDGSDPRRIPLPLPRTQLNWPDWDPNGNRITAASTGSDDRLLVTDTLAQDTAWITPEGLEASHPSWSPMGDWIAYVRRRNTTRFDIHLVRPDGSDDHVLVGDGVDPAFSPDGQSVAFSRRGNLNMSIWAIRIDGSGLKQLTDPK